MEQVGTGERSETTKAIPPPLHYSPARRLTDKEARPMSTTTAERPLADRALEGLRRAGNPFRNCFARNPDDEVCARYHVSELFAAERDILLGVMDLYRYDPTA